MSEEQLVEMERANQLNEPLRSGFAAQILCALIAHDGGSATMSSDKRDALCGQAVAWADSLRKALAK